MLRTDGRLMRLSCSQEVQVCKAEGVRAANLCELVRGRSVLASAQGVGHRDASCIMHAGGVGDTDDGVLHKKF